MEALDKILAIANKLDQKGYYDLANTMDSFIYKMAEESFLEQHRKDTDQAILNKLRVPFWKHTPWKPGGLTPQEKEKWNKVFMAVKERRNQYISWLRTQRLSKRDPTQVLKEFEQLLASDANRSPHFATWIKDVRESLNKTREYYKSHPVHVKYPKYDPGAWSFLREYVGWPDKPTKYKRKYWREVGEEKRKKETSEIEKQMKVSRFQNAYNDAIKGSKLKSLNPEGVWGRNTAAASKAVELAGGLKKFREMVASDSLTPEIQKVLQARGLL
jgi:hypothetical protein